MLTAPSVHAPPPVVRPQTVAREEPVAFPVGQPDRDAFPFTLWAKLLEREWRRPGWAIAGTPDPFGHPGLQQAVVQHLGAARGFVCSPDAVVVTGGVRQSISLFARVVLAAGDAAWVEDPGYPGMQEGLAEAGVRAVPVPIDGSGFSVATALSLAPEARLAVVAPSHHFPLGTVLTLQRRLELLHWAERSGGWIAEDDFDGEYRYSGRPLAPLRALDRSGRVAYLGSFSKILFPALRLSFLVLPAGLVEAARRVIASKGSGASLLGQGALARFIGDGHFAVHLRRTRLLYAARQEMLIEAASRHLAGQLAIERDPGGMHLIGRPVETSGFDDRLVAEAALAHGVKVGPLSAFYQAGAASHGLILGYAGTPERMIEPAIELLSRCLSVKRHLHSL
jgi:GntR family transcriptional regulator/MocR family aminotransferase